MSNAGRRVSKLGICVGIVSLPESFEFRLVHACAACDLQISPDACLPGSTVRLDMRRVSFYITAFAKYNIEELESLTSAA